jgi:hypothetical protein
MSLAKTIPSVIQQMILTRMTTLFLTGAGGDLSAAREAAVPMLATYHPETAEELRLAAQIISFSLQAFEALSQASAPDINMSRTLRLRGSAVSLNRESEKDQRRLDQIQQARRAATPAQPEQARPTPAQTMDKSAPPAPTNQSRTHAYDQQDLRIAASLKRAGARTAASHSTDSVSSVQTLCSSVSA